jgi:hypothetical protein
MGRTTARQASFRIFKRGLPKKKRLPTEPIRHEIILIVQGGDGSENDSIAEVERGKWLITAAEVDQE